MAQLLVQDRLQPSLLDRLIDDSPADRQETDDKKVLTKQGLRQAVLRDLSWLFNASGHAPSLDPKKTPHAFRSVINYGLPDLSGQYASTVQTRDLEQSIKESILLFEPRILPNTLEITTEMETGSMNAHNAISLVVRGMLWAQPVPLEFLMRSRIDLEEGRIVAVSTS
jgi:type VI secretion system protein ImpF